MRGVLLPRRGMDEHVMFRLIRLRQKLRRMPTTEHIDEVLGQLNVVMMMLLNNQVCIDFMLSGEREDTVVPKLVDLIASCETHSDGGLGDDICADLQCIMSSCVNSTLLGSSEGPLPSDAMPMSEKMQHMRSSLELIL